MFKPCLIACAILLASGILTQPVNAQFVPCHVTNVNVTHPDSAPAAQAFQLIVQPAISCGYSPGPIIRVRVDLTSGRNVIASAWQDYDPYYFISAAIPTIPIDLPPMQPGTFTVELAVYVISEPSGWVLGQSQQQVPITVQNVSSITVTSTSASSTSWTSEVAVSTLTSTAVQAPTTTAAQLVVSTVSSSPSQTGVIGQGAELAYVGLAAAAVILVVAILLTRRKRPSGPKEA